MTCCHQAAHERCCQRQMHYTLVQCQSAVLLPLHVMHVQAGGSGTQQPCILSVHDQMYRTMKRLTLKRHNTGAKKQMLVYVSVALPFRR